MSLLTFRHLILVPRPTKASEVIPAETAPAVMPQRVAYQQAREVAEKKKATKETLLTAKANYQPQPMSYNELLLPTQRLPYVEGAEHQGADHRAQWKLLGNELLVLSRAGLLDTEVNVVYAGAAPGHHLADSLRLFPKARWHLYDTTDVVVTDPRIKFYKQLFEDADAVRWSSVKNVVFISDIRSVGALNAEKYEIEGGVSNDMIMQQRWVEIIRPLVACLKFRLPYIAGYRPNISVEYLPGELYVQPYARGSASEGRLVVLPEHYGRRITYDAAETEDRFFYHNNVRRVMSRWDDESFAWLLAQVTDKPVSSLTSQKTNTRRDNA